jgi:hypothetical protein
LELHETAQHADRRDADLRRARDDWMAQSLKARDLTTKAPNMRRIYALPVLPAWTPIPEMGTRQASQNIALHDSQLAPAMLPHVAPWTYGEANSADICFVPSGCITARENTIWKHSKAQHKVIWHAEDK